MQWNFRLSAVALFAIGLSGCGPGDRLAVYPVSGVIKFNGAPMKGGGSIAFLPKESRPGKMPGGTIAEDGTYSLTTYEPDDGALPGEYRVVITQITVEEPESVIDGSGERTKKPTRIVDEKDWIPAINADMTRSPLTATVEAKDENKIDFDIKGP
jgi:hypothetical protein